MYRVSASKARFSTRSQKKILRAFFWLRSLRRTLFCSAKARVRILAVPTKKNAVQMDCTFLGGEGGIRTLGSFYTTPVFKTGTINHSVTSPYWWSKTILTDTVRLVERLAANCCDPDGFCPSIHERMSGIFDRRAGRYYVIQ